MREKLNTLGAALIVSALGACLVVATAQKLCLAQTPNGQETVTNKVVMKMLKAKVSTDIIVKKIQVAPSVKFDLSSDDIIKLREDGVDDKIVLAMLERAKAEHTVPGHR